MQSENIDLLAKALVEAQGEFSAVPKGSTNPFFKSKYASLPDVKASAGPVLAKHGLAVAQFISEGDTLTTYLLHQSGQFIAHSMTLHLVKDDPQAQGSAVTYARRYSYMSCLGLVADDDDDGNLASKPQSGDSKPATSRPKPLAGLQATQEPSKQDSAPIPLVTPLQRQIREHKAYISMASTEKGNFLSDAVGHEVKSITSLSDDDCEQILAKLRTL